MKGFYLRNFGEIIKPLQGSQLLSDVVFYVGKQEKEFYGHRFLFALTSNFWMKKLYPLGWRKSEQVLFKFRIPDFHPSVFQYCIDFVYQRRVSLSSDNVEGILRFACFFEMGDLISLCLKFIIPKLTFDNALLCLDQILQYKNKYLQIRILGHIEENSKEYLSQKFCFNKLKEDTVKIILQSKKIEINEIDLFRRLLERAKNLVKIKNNNQVNQNLSNPKQLRDEIKNLIPLINLHLIGPSGLMEIHQTGIIDSSELFKILIKHEQTLFLEEEKRNEHLQTKELSKRGIEDKNETTQSLQFNYESDDFYSESSSDYPSDVEIIPNEENQEYQATSFVSNKTNDGSSSNISPVMVNDNNAEIDDYDNNFNLSGNQANVPQITTKNEETQSPMVIVQERNDDDNTSFYESINSSKNSKNNEKEKGGKEIENAKREKEIENANNGKETENRKGGKEIEKEENEKETEKEIEKEAKEENEKEIEREKNEKEIENQKNEKEIEIEENEKETEKEIEKEEKEKNERGTEEEKDEKETEKEKNEKEIENQKNEKEIEIEKNGKETEKGREKEEKEKKEKETEEEKDEKEIENGKNEKEIENQKNQKETEIEKNEKETEKKIEKEEKKKNQKGIAKEKNGKEEKEKNEKRSENEKKIEKENANKLEKEIYSDKEDKINIKIENDNFNQKKENVKKFQKNVFIDESESNDEESENSNFGHQNDMELESVMEEEGEEEGEEGEEEK
ncbi:btb (poz) domain-containing 2a-related [Anaeramoeba flamelloides]|uniref:Btb (Poz) domain-containing 2a-related n=1 Tax=Anaeramoeba flamelloides TaxID=1746091 RepID=A0AAV7Y3X9_9EUKA|nr:btb (poz) domain-containing 2a-related [Anaeramoeba flamelloides]